MEEDEKTAPQADDTASKPDNKDQTTDTDQTPPEDKQTDTDKPKKTAWYTRVIAREAAEKRDAKREAESYKSQNAALLQELAKKNPDGSTVSLTQSQIDDRAREISAERDFVKECNRIADVGNEEFDDFDKTVGNLQQIGGDKYRELLKIAADDLPEAHKILHHLGNNPEEAERLFSLPPTKMAREVAKLELRLKDAPKTISKATDPIVPLKPKSSKAFDPNDPDADRNEWSKWREKTRRRR